ncbi:hypothetical protein OW763_00985 [Clostridium aestuarii]|uniref:Uncharacterized protein n=2 Tax=Clostridium aestuarii TaxID=338193 RepID=A0ABT4CVC0_9CLOT|nr:hypothetical protein [Clostridium aestuarii]
MISNIVYKRVNDSQDILNSYERYVKNKENDENIFEKVNFEKEANIISVEEALLINENKVKRSLISDILKGNYEKHIKILKKSIEDEDSETSHYAAAAIMEIKRQFQINIGRIETEYQNNKNDLEVLKEYVEVLKRYLFSGLLDKSEYKRILFIYSGMLEKVLSIDSSNEQYFVEKINCEFEFENYSNAKKLCDEFVRYHSQKEQPYLMYMKLYYMTKNYTRFKETIEFIKKNRKIKLSNEGLNLLRFWIEGESVV